MSLQASLAKKRSAYRQDLEKASRSILRQLSAMPEVEKVILFGSYAAGRRDLFTDLDLLVVMDTQKNFITRTTELYRKIQSGVDLDMLVYTPEEFEQQKNKPFIRNALASGKVIYERRGP
jgi:predicted nucleotidyltransferase